ncbi:glycosyltransferase family 61 protein [Agrobacterium rosae]
MLFKFASSLAKNVTALTDHTSVTRAPPINLVPSDKYLFKPAMKYEVKPSHLIEINNVMAMPDGWLYHNITLLKDGFVVVRQPSLSKRISKLPKRILAVFSAKEVRSTFWITDNWSQGYFHWMTDAIPRLFLAKENCAEIDLLLPSRYRSIDFIQETLEPFLLNSLTIIPDDKAVSVKTLLFPTYSAGTGNYNEKVIKKIGELYRRAYGAPQRGERRIYVSRSKARARHILNEKEIIPILDRFGFETVHCEDLSFAEQVKIFSQASIIIGPHGAGLTNMMFMQCGAAVLEIHPHNTTVNNCYFAMASAFHHRYFYMLPDNALSSHRSDIVVDVKQLENYISMMVI